MEQMKTQLIKTRQNSSARTSIAAAILVVAMAPSPVWAQSCAACTGAVQALSGKVDLYQSQMATAIALLQERLVKAIHGNAATISAEQAKTAEMVAEANHRTQAGLEQMRQGPRFQVADGCALLAPTKAESADAPRLSGGLGGGAGRGGAGYNPGSRTHDSMKKANDVAARRAPVPSPEAQATMAASGACASYAVGSTVRGNACELSGFAARASSGYPDADIRAETLFDGPQTGSGTAFRRRLTISADGDERTAVESYLRNLNTPVDLRELKKNEMSTDAGRQYRMFRDIYEARMSMAEKPVRMLVADRIAMPSLKPVVEQLLSSSVAGPFVRSYLSRNAPDWNAKGISVDELIALEAERRHSNRDWHLNMASLPPEAHVKEQTQMMAYQIYLLSRIYERQGVQTVLQGQSTAIATRSEMLPQLMSLHAAASK